MRSADRSGPSQHRSQNVASRILRNYLAKRALARCTSVGGDIELVGVPSVRNLGRLEIGARMRIVSEPVVSHLVVEHGATLRIGDDVRIAHGCGIAANASVEIGDRVTVAPFTLMLDTDYHVPGAPSERAPCTPIRIGNRVQIGRRVVILRGSTIGDDVTVADGSVVSGPIAAGAKVAGVPAREVRADVPNHSGGGTVVERVVRVAMRTFRLVHPPHDDHGPDQIGAWDSLGMLSLLFGLEEEFGVVLEERAMSRVSSIRSAAEAVERALATRAGH